MRGLTNGNAAPGRPRRLAGLAAGVLLGAIGCGGAPLPSDTGLSTGRPPAANPASDEGLPATLLARLESEEAWPLYAPRGAGGLAVVVEGGRFRGIAVPAEGGKPSAPRNLAAAPAELRLAALGALDDGYVLAWVEPRGSAHHLVALRLDAEGAPRGEPAEVASSARAPSSLDVLAAGTAGLLVWDTESAKEAGSDVFVAPASPGGKGDRPALSGVLAWDVAPSASGPGAALVAVVASEKRNDGATELGRVVFSALDGEGRAGAPVALSAEPSARPDVSLVALGGHYVAGWTDERGPEPTVHVAALAQDGRVVRQAAPVLPPGGEQYFVGLVAPPSGPGPGLLAWEEPLRSPPGLRTVRLAPIGQEGALGLARASLALSADGRPDLAAFEGGFAALTLAPAGMLGAKADAVWPAFVRFGPGLEVIASAPVRASLFGGDGLPLFVRSLACASSRCTALASGAGERPPLALLAMPVRTSAKPAPAAPIRPEARPHAASIVALWNGEHVAEVAASAPPGEATRGGFSAWVTYVPPEEAEGEAARSPEATLTVAPLPASPDARPGEPVVISKRALSTGGLALASVPGGDTVLAWVAREKNEPQVFVTKLGASGEKVAQRLVTTLERRGKGAARREPRDVAIAPAPALPGLEEGFVVAWVDPRHGDGGEVYAARIDRSLRRMGVERRITEADGAASEVALAVRDGEVKIAWADARDDVEGGSADVFVATLDAKTLAKKGDEARLLDSPAHSRSPAVAWGEKGAVVAWVEEADEASDPGGVASVYVAEPGGVPVPLDLGGSASSVSLTCAPRASVCRGVAARAAGTSLELFAFAPVPGRPIPLRPLATLSGPPGSDVAPAFAGDRLVFADNTASGARVRAMTLAW